VASWIVLRVMNGRDSSIRYTVSMRLLRSAIAVLTLAFTACTNVHTPADAKGRLAAPDDLVEELHRSVTHLAVDIGERNCYRPAKLEAAAEWIAAEFKAMGYPTRRLPVQVPAGMPYGCGARTVWNVEAEKPGTDLANEIIVIGAHYDSKVAMPHWHDHGPPLPQNPGTPGADDNASGIAGVLAVARMLKDHPLRRTIKFVAFVNEEPPFFRSDVMGSLVYAKSLVGEGSLNGATGRKIAGMISFEMLGYYAKAEQTKRLFGTAVTGLTSKPDYVAMLSNWTSGPFAQRCGLTFSRHASITVRVTRLPLLSKRFGWSDDWSFWQVGVPAFSVTDTAYLRNDHYHEVSDTPATLDFIKMAEVVWGLQFVVDALGGEASGARGTTSGIASKDSTFIAPVSMALSRRSRDGQVLVESWAGSEARFGSLNGGRIFSPRVSSNSRSAS